eukprot:TRINITY_DN59531_c0_g1_i1.p1 TRINITY_DN59531_c0_g1~~TRINITY_DN59531_c0_g1_i1.p1  ORF type:complete len:402 (+),score=59.70 TRINITY_DN59531_c0_g1_i1:83-1207(+)
MSKVMHMTRFSLAFLVWEFLVHASWAYRSIERESRGAVITGGLPDPVKDFLQAAAALAPQGQVAGTLAVNLEEGVKWTISDSSFTTEADGTLKLVVEHSKVSQGEIATPSKVPVQWTLENRTTYNFRIAGDGRWRLYVTGIKLLPFSEGLELYEASGAADACNQIADIVKQVVCERAVLFKWYQKQWNRFKTSAYKSQPAHKLGRILSGMYGSTTTYYAVKAGAKGSEAWEKILYSLITIPPLEIDFFEFLSNSENPDEIEMAMVSHEVFHGTYDTLDLAAYTGLNFKAKNGAEFEAGAFESQRSMAEIFARSGINFGAMSAKGRDDVLNDSRVRGGTAKYILNFASPCTESKTDENADPTVGCKDTHGRVYWK